MNKLITSSSNPNQIALTIRGVLIGLVPLIAHITGLTGQEITTIIDLLVELVTVSMTVLSVAMTLIGLLRKAYYRRWSA